MWIQTQHGTLINLDKMQSVGCEVMGNVGRVQAYDVRGDIFLLGEYRDYAAQKVLDEIGMFTGQKHIYIMPDEKIANEKFARDKQ